MNYIIFYKCRLFFHEFVEDNISISYHLLSIQCVRQILSILSSILILNFLLCNRGIIIVGMGEKTGASWLGFHSLEAEPKMGFLMSVNIVEVF